MILKEEWHTRGGSHGFAGRIRTGSPKNERLRMTGRLCMLVSLLTVASLSVGCYTSPKFRITENPASVRTAVIEFESWTDANGMSLSHGPSEYALRRRLTEHGREFLVRSGYDGTPDSEECYSISVEKSFALRKVSRDEWDEAEQFGGTRGGLLFGHKTSDARITYRERDYERKGEIWRYASVSPDGRWICLQSYDDGDWIRIDLGLPLGGPGVRSGATYLDVHDTGTGELVFSARTRRWDAVVYREPEWIGDDYFLQAFKILDSFGDVLPGERCLIVKLPDGESKD